VLVVVALVFPVLLLLAVLGLGLVEHRLDRRLLGTDAERYLDSHHEADDVEVAIAVHAERLLNARQRARRRST